MPDALNVWMNGEHVGRWSRTRSGIDAFDYAAAWMHSPQVRALSLSLPITADGAVRGEAVGHYFDNLLPDSPGIRRRLGTRFRTPSGSSFDLLAAIGRDCVGAVQLLPPDELPDGWNRIRSQPLTSAEIERILLAVTSDAPLGQRGTDEDADFRISIAGAQEKTALLRIGDTWHRPLGATPTTHILKLPLGLVGNMRADMSDSVENEWLCAQILGELGLQVANTTIARFGKQKALVVERFDRRWMNVPEGAASAPGFRPPRKAWIARLPQEDFCQACACPPERKYEAEGGPGMRRLTDLLAQSDRAQDDRTQFLLAQLAFWLLAATDGHAKNFSIFHTRGGGFHLTPLYDVLSAWPIIGNGAGRLPLRKARLAMAVRTTNTHYRLHEIQARHWHELAQASGVGHLWDRMQALVQEVDGALARTRKRLPRGFPPAVWNAVADGMRQHARRFQRGD